MGNSVLRHIMKTFIVLAASAIALASGLCLEDDEVVAMCTVGTPIGSKLEAAAAQCDNDGPAAGRRRGKGKGKGKGQKKCPSVEDVWNKVQEEMGDELCVFQQIGWLDESFEFDNATTMADIATLPEEVSMALDVNDMGECVESVMEYMGEDKKMAKCWDKYSEEDQEALMGIGYLTASIKCFLDGFMDACGEHVKTELMSAYFTQAAGRR